MWSLFNWILPNYWKLHCMINYIFLIWLQIYINICDNLKADERNKKGLLIKQTCFSRVCVLLDSSVSQFSFCAHLKVILFFELSYNIMYFTRTKYSLDVTSFISSYHWLGKNRLLNNKLISKISDLFVIFQKWSEYLRSTQAPQLLACQ